MVNRTVVHFYSIIKVIVLILPQGVEAAGRLLNSLRSRVPELQKRGPGREIKESHLWRAIKVQIGECDTIAWAKYMDFWNLTGSFFRM